MNTFRRFVICPPEFIHDIFQLSAQRFWKKKTLHGIKRYSLQDRFNEYLFAPIERKRRLQPATCFLNRSIKSTKAQVFLRPTIIGSPRYLSGLDAIRTPKKLVISSLNPSFTLAPK
ncbi:hypothetical protein EPI10_006186 [Gossypium australe]|uniref:Uncharacterized protein n=1 Tax=Gossypium australe TaxID=47621 RepID=A0A5B6WT48_9ROSI|nr:hypothetical protein EPI10_006186 [Gossypium australe]